MACLPRRQRTTATSGWTTTAGSTAVSSGPESCGSVRPVWPAPRYPCTPAVRAFGYCRNGSGKPSSSAMNRLAPQKLTRSPSQGRLPDDARADTEPQADSCAADRPPPWSPDRHAVPPRHGSGTRAGSIPAYFRSSARARNPPAAPGSCPYGPRGELDRSRCAIYRVEREHRLTVLRIHSGECFPACEM